MQPRVAVTRNHHELDTPCEYHARVEGSGLGLVDACGPTPEIAVARARDRWRLRWLGVEWQGMATPPEARRPHAGQVAINGHRFALWRQLNRVHERIIHWIMLNPGTARAERNDATLQRVCDDSHRWGYGWVTIGNLWSYRASEAQLGNWLSRSGEWVVRANADNDRWLQWMAERADLVVVAWGEHGAIDNRGLAALRLLARLGKEPHALGITLNGQPQHPLQSPWDLQPQPFADIRASMENATCHR